MHSGDNCLRDIGVAVEPESMLFWDDMMIYGAGIFGCYSPNDLTHLAYISSMSGFKP